MLVLRARPRPLGQYGAMVGNERRDLGLIADRCPPLSRLHEAVAYHGHILQKAMASDCQHELGSRLKQWIHSRRQLEGHTAQDWTIQHS